jgi:flavodoxin
LPKTLILCKSIHHGNTWKVAQAIADTMRADIAAPEEFPYNAVDRYDLVGFGSGIYYGDFHSRLRDWVRGLPDAANRSHKAFVFSTSGLPFLRSLWCRPLKAELARKGFDVVGEFHCRGFDSWGPLWLAGGINRSHPDAHDLGRAAEFARVMMEKVGTERAYRAAG